MHATRHSNSYADHPRDLLFSVLENTELGVVVVDQTARAIYMNASARNLLRCPRDILPESVIDELRPMLERLRRSAQAVEKWSHGDVTLRVRARPLDRYSGLTVLEISVAHATSGRALAEQLSLSLQLSITDAKLLGLLWRGLSNDEIAALLNVRVGTVKSRLFRLYQKLGVRRRPAAVLRAAEILAPEPRGTALNTGLLRE